MKKIFKWFLNFIIVIFVIIAIIAIALLLCTNEKGVIKIKNYSLVIAKETISDIGINNNDMLILEDTMFNKLKVGDVVSYTKNVNNYMPDIKVGKISSIGRNSSTQLSLIIQNSDNTSDEVSEGSYIGKWSNTKIVFLGVVFGTLLTKTGFLLGIILPLILLLMYQVVKIVITFKLDDDNSDDIKGNYKASSNDSVDFVNNSDEESLDQNLTIRDNNEDVVILDDNSIKSDSNTVIDDSDIIDDSSVESDNSRKNESEDINKDDDIEVL